MRMRAMFAAAVIAGLALPAPASALLIPAVQKIREGASRLRAGVIYSVDLDTPFTVAPGDELDLMLTFGDGGTLTLANARTIRLVVGPIDGNDMVGLQSETMLGFLGASGPLVDPTAPRNFPGGPGELGGSFDAADFLRGSGPIAFSGLRLRSGVIAEVGAGRPATVGRLFFSFTGTNTGLVPEPSSWALLLAGFALTGVTLRRRQTISMKLSSTRF